MEEAPFPVLCQEAKQNLEENRHGMFHVFCKILEPAWLISLDAAH